MALPARAKLAAGLAVVAVTLATLLATLPRIGLTDDADAYLGAAVSYAGWGARALSLGVTALRRDQIDGAWRPNAEHPPLAKVVMGAAWWTFHRWLGWTGQVTAARLGTVLLSCLLAWLLFSVMWDHVGRLAALAAPLFLLTMPRFFFDMHAETLDLAVATTTFWTLTAFLRGLRSAGWAAGTGLVFGLALLSKLNAPFLLLACAAFVLVSQRHRFAVDRDGQIHLPAVPLALLSMVVLGPLLFWALWPWLWFDTWNRLAAHLEFHLHHYGILFLYFGRIYDHPPAPWHAPFVMTAITTPPVVLALSLLGGWRALAEAFPRGPPRPLLPPEAGPRRDLGLLLVLWALTAIGTVAFSGGPKYGGVKLFLPLFPPLAALAGWAVEWLAGLLRRRWPRRWTGPALATALALPGAVSLWWIHPCELSYYNALVGGLPGAVRAGFERQYYDLVYVDLVEWMNRSLPEGTRVTFLPNNKEYLRNSPWWFRDGRIRGDLRFVELGQADVLVLTHERRWREYPALLERYRGLPQLWELRAEGVPLLTVYRLH